MVYENFVPFIATRRVVCRQQRLERQVDEMTYKI
jgi:hypothetical protein